MAYRRNFRSRPRYNSRRSKFNKYQRRLASKSYVNYTVQKKFRQTLAPLKVSTEVFPKVGIIEGLHQDNQDVFYPFDLLKELNADKGVQASEWINVNRVVLTYTLMNSMTAGTDALASIVRLLILDYFGDTSNPEDRIFTQHDRGTPSESFANIPISPLKSSLPINKSFCRIFYDQKFKLHPLSFSKNNISTRITIPINKKFQVPITLEEGELPANVTPRHRLFLCWYWEPTAFNNAEGDWYTNTEIFSSFTSDLYFRDS
jgi:hypothetical protein